MTRLAELIQQWNETHPDEPPMSQVRLAEKVGLSPMTVHRHIAGKTSISLLQASAYSRVLGIDLRDLIPARHLA